MASDEILPAFPAAWPSASCSAASQPQALLQWRFGEGLFQGLESRSKSTAGQLKRHVDVRVVLPA
jgi:hypothetical protein